MRIHLIFMMLISIFLISCTSTVDSNHDFQYSCKLDSDCVSAAEIGCYTTNNGFVEYGICPAVNKDKFQPLCDKGPVQCREPFSIICHKGMCKSIECEKDSDCVSVTEVGCYLNCKSEEGRDCSGNNMCPAVNKNTFEPICDELVGCNEPSKIVCENNECKSLE
jgi:hypothetical protein